MRSALAPTGTPRCTGPLVLVLGASLLLACHEPAPVPFVEEPVLGPSLEATFDDPLLLTVAAPRARTRYLEDEGYTLARDAEGVVRLVTDSAGDLGFALSLDGTWILGEADWRRPAVIHHATSDTLLWDFQPVEGLTVEARFAVATSRVAVLEVVFRDLQDRRRSLTLFPWLRRCGDGRYEDPLDASGGVRMSHAVEVDFMLEVLGPGTYLEEVADTLVAPGRDPEWAALEECTDSVTADILALASVGPSSPHRAALVGFPLAVKVPAGGAVSVTLLRGAVALERAQDMENELASAQVFSPSVLLTEAATRAGAIPALDGIGPGAQMVYRSGHVLLEQLVMPAEGSLLHDYYVFSREPTWWFARLGQHTHESLAMILLAHREPETAMGSQRIFMENVGINGYLPYSIGPVVQQTHLGTASSPFFSYVAWEIGKVTQDASFVAEAYAAGTRIHDFWRNRRDVDQDGLAEWGGYGITESIRDLENVIWVNVAPPEEVEAICLNSLLVKDASVLGEMADYLGLTEEAQGWRALAEERAALVNAQMWDEETGFYYHVTRDGHTFDFEAPGDLKRMEIAGLLPLWAGFAPPERRGLLLAKLTDPALFWRPYGIASLAAADPYYDGAASQCCRWRGPVWVQWQFLMMRALIELGEETLAVELTRRVLAAVETQLTRVHQFRELYDPDDSTAPNDSMPNYIWSALVALMMQETAPFADPPYGREP